MFSFYNPDKTLVMHEFLFDVPQLSLVSALGIAGSISKHWDVSNPGSTFFISSPKLSFMGALPVWA